MNKGINLLVHNSRTNSNKNGKAFKRLRIIAVGLLFLVSAFSVIFFILVALSPIPQLRNQQKNASFNLSLSNEDIVKLSLIKERTQTAKEVLGKRKNYEMILDSVYKKIPSGVTVDTISIKNNKLLLTLSSKSLMQLDSLISEIRVSESTEKLYSKVDLESLFMEQNTFFLTLNFSTI